MSKLHIAMYAANLRHWGRLDPRALSEDVPSPAGTEIAMMGVARALARRGHRVTVFAETDGGTFDGVDYIPAEFSLPLLTTLDTDVIVSWQDSGVFLYPMKTKLKVLMNQSATLGLGQAATAVDRYFGISRFSAQTLLDSDAYADPAKMWITRNGVDLTRFPHFAKGGKLHYAPEKVERPHSIAWLSSPDRGLHHLVDIFKLVREQVPDATLDILYDFDGPRANYAATFPGSAFVRWLEKAAELKETPGVRIHNHLSQPRVAEILQDTRIVAYPADPIRPTETYCIAVTEAMAAGCVVLVSDADCLPENYGDAAIVLPRPIDPKAWADAIVKHMTDQDAFEAQQAKSLKLAGMCDFDDVAWEWETFFESYLDGGEIYPDMSLTERKKVYLPAATPAAA